MAERTDTRLRLTLYVLLLVYILNFLDRQIVGILAQPIGEGSWSQRYPDRADDRARLRAVLYRARHSHRPFCRPAEDQPDRVIAVCLAVWSAMTALCGAAQSFVQLFLARIGVGIGEAGGTPPAHSLIAELAPPEKRASAMSFYQLGPPIGGLIGMVLGGYLADRIGWRWAFVVVGAPGVALALVVCRGAARSADDAIVAEAAKQRRTPKLRRGIRRHLVLAGEPADPAVGRVRRDRQFRHADLGTDLSAAQLRPQRRPDRPVVRPGQRHRFGAGRLVRRPIRRPHAASAASSI